MLTAVLIHLMSDVRRVRKSWLRRTAVAKHKIFMILYFSTTELICGPTNATTAFENLNPLAMSRALDA